MSATQIELKDTPAVLPAASTTAVGDVLIGIQGGVAKSFQALSVGGDMTLAGIQTVTGVKTFGSGKLVATAPSIIAPTGIVKGDVGLGSVDNTADTAKPVSTAVTNALLLKADLVSPTFTGTVNGISKSMVGLASVDNTADTAKPISTLQAAGLLLKADKLLTGFTLASSLDVTAADTVLQAIGKLQAQLDAVVGSAVQVGAIAASATDAPNATAVINYVTAQIAGVVAGANDPVITAYATAIPFTGYRTMGETTVSAPIAFTVGAGTTAYSEVLVSLIADGVSNVTFAAAFNLSGEQAYDNTAGRVNNIVFSYLNARPYYSITLGPIIDIGAPYLLSAVVADATPTIVTLTFSEVLSGTLAAAARFAVSGSTVSSRAAGATADIINLTLSSALVNGDVKTVSYTANGTNNLQDAVGNQTANIVAHAITNNVVAPSTKVRLTTIQTRVTESGDATNGYNYIGNADSNFYSDLDEGVSTKTLASSTNGYIRAVAGNIVSGDGNTQKGMLAFDTVNTVTLRGATCKGIVYGYASGANVYYVTTGQYSQSVGNGTPVTPTSGDWLQVRRSGTDYICEVSQNSGSSWTIIHTYSGASTAALYAKACVSQVFSLNNLTSDAMA